MPPSAASSARPEPAGEQHARDQRCAEHRALLCAVGLLTHGAQARPADGTSLANWHRVVTERSGRRAKASETIDPYRAARPVANLMCDGTHPGSRTIAPAARAGGAFRQAPGAARAAPDGQASGTRTSLRPGASTSTSATCRRSTRPPTSSSSLAETSRSGTVSRNAVKVSAAAARKAREEEGRRAYEAEQRARAHAADRAKHDPFGSRVPDHSVVHRYARCISYPEWGVGTVSGIYFSGDGDDVQQWARMSFQVGVRTVPAGSLQFVDFSTPDPGAERVERFMTAAQHALAEGDPALAAQRLIYARDADPDQPGGAAAADRRLLAVRQPAGGRPRRARLGPSRDRPADGRALRLAHLRGHGRDRPRRRGGRARHPARARGRVRVGAAGAAAPAAAASATPRSTRSSAPACSSRRSRSCSTSRSPTTWPATSAPRSPQPRRRR